MTNNDPRQIDDYAKILWGYLKLDQPLKKCDVILVFGGHDPNVAVYAAKLFSEKLADCFIISGGMIHPPELYGNTKPMIEAHILKEIAIKNNVPESKILVEDRAKNTSENFWFTEKLLQDLNHTFTKCLIVVKPYTERRTFATALKRWPSREIIVASEKIEYDAYACRGIPREKIINMMVGEIKRIQEYPAIGYSIPQPIPANVLSAYLNLQQLGYTQRLQN